jgi:hypothetical protein
MKNSDFCRKFLIVIHLSQIGAAVAYLKRSLFEKVASSNLVSDKFLINKYFGNLKIKINSVKNMKTKLYLNCNLNAKINIGLFLYDCNESQRYSKCGD